MSDPSDSLVFRVDDLRGASYFIRSISSGLDRFTDLWHKNRTPRVVWDLRQLRKGTINTGALAVFSSVAERIKNFSWETPRMLLPGPEIQKFLYGIRFIRTLVDNQIVYIGEGELGGFRVEALHPSTAIVRFYGKNTPNPSGPNIVDWKDSSREEFHKELFWKHNWSRLFRSDELPHPLDEGSIHEILNVCAELGVNSLLWGRSPAYVSAQVKSSGFTAYVSDAGHGVFRTLCEKEEDRLSSKPVTVQQALLYSSVFSSTEMGLFRAIDSVTKNGGKVVLSSDSSVLVWNLDNWTLTAEALSTDPAVVCDEKWQNEVLGTVSKGDVGFRGYRWDLNRGLRGTRIHFELPYLKP